MNILHFNIKQDLTCFQVELQTEYWVDIKKFEFWGVGCGSKENKFLLSGSNNNNRAKSTPSSPTPPWYSFVWTEALETLLTNLNWPYLFIA